MALCLENERKNAIANMKKMISNCFILCCANCTCVKLPEKVKIIYKHFASVKLPTFSSWPNYPKIDLQQWIHSAQSTTAVEGVHTETLEISI